MPVIGPFRDVALGCYFLTKMKEPAADVQLKVYSSLAEARTANEYGHLPLNQKIKVPNPKSQDHELIETTVGRLILNASLPDDYPYVNKLIATKELKAMVRDIIEKYTGEGSIDTLDKIKHLGFEYCTLSGVSWGMDDLIVPPEKEKMLEEAEGK
jgi:DNA-directed RNA polymerase subunit beta'